MHKKNISSLFTSIGAGFRIAAGMLMASIRTVQTLAMLFLLTATLLLYYFDIIHRTIFAGGSSLAWATLKIIKQWGINLPMHVFGVEWILHFPEHFLLLSLMALLSLMMVHVTHSSLTNGNCGVGRSFFRSIRAWRFIFIYAAFMSIMIWMVGDVHINGIRWMLHKINKTPAMIESLYDPVSGKRMMDLLLNAPYWLSIETRLSVSIVWYLVTFLLFPVVALEQCSFIVGLRRSCALMLNNLGLVMSATFFYLMIYVGVIVATLYGEVATFPSLAGLGMKSNVQVVVLFAFMTLLLCAVHSALVTAGFLIAGVCVYRIVNHQSMPILHPLYVKRPYWSCFLYLFFYIFYWIVIRCGIHVQMPKI